MISYCVKDASGQVHQEGKIGAPARGTKANVVRRYGPATGAGDHADGLCRTAGWRSEASRLKYAGLPQIDPEYGLMFTYFRPITWRLVGKWEKDHKHFVTDKLIVASIQWAKRIMQKIDESIH